MIIHGMFGVDGEQDCAGMIEIDGERTKVNITSKNLEKFLEASTLTGLSDQHQNITCIGCLTLYSSDGHFKRLASVHRVEIFPHFIVIGRDRFHPDHQNVNRVRFQFTDINELVKNKLSVRSTCDSDDNLRQIVQSLSKKDEDIGDLVVVSYFAGNRVIFTSKTSLGQVTATNGFQVPSVGEVFEHYVEVDIDFDDPIPFDECISRVKILRDFFTVITGRPQAITDLAIQSFTASSDPKFRSWSKVQWSNSPSGPRTGVDAYVSYSTALHAGRFPNQFADVLRHWVDQHREKVSARYHCVAGIEAEGLYSTSRLIMAANIFDHIPHSLPMNVGGKVQLDSDVKTILCDARKSLRAIGRSSSKDKAMSGLDKLINGGRESEPILIEKVIHHSRSVKNIFPGQLRNIDDVLRCAVQTRNHFVHGNDFDFDSISDFLVLMTNCLEFVFVLSDLLSSQWDAADWIKEEAYRRHPIGRYVQSHEENIDAFMRAKANIKRLKV